MAHSSKPPFLNVVAPINSIPPYLVPRFDPKFVKDYTKYQAGRLRTDEVPIKEYRKDPLKYHVHWGRQKIDEDGLLITEEKCPVVDGEISIRIVRKLPVDSLHRSKKRPAYINYHGGGWVFGDLKTDHDFCKRLVQELDIVTFDVDYRLAPEHPYPIPINDCWAAFQWVIHEKASELHLDLNKVAVGGTSAGGNLTAVVAHMCRDAGFPLAFQFLAQPVTHLHVFTPEGELRDDCPYDSYRELEHTVCLPLKRLSWIHRQYLGPRRSEKMENDWRISPMLSPDFTGLAPALILSSELDILRDEDEEYGRKMNAAGSTAEVIRIPGASHIVGALDDCLEGGKQYNRECIRAMKAAFRARDTLLDEHQNQDISSCSNLKIWLHTE